jgi:hypothetical protein
METIFDGGEGVGSGGGGGKEWRTARTQILTNLEKQKRHFKHYDMHTFLSIYYVNKPYFFFKKVIN